MDEGTTLEKTNIGEGDILRNRYWVFNIIWSGIWILLVWYIIFSGFFVFLFDPFGFIFLFIGVGFSSVLQIRYTMGWSSRLPLFAPKPFRQKNATRNAIIVAITLLPIFIALSWLRSISPWFHSFYVSVALALMAFAVGVLISGLWISLAGLIWWENREGIRVVKQDNKFIALNLEDVHLQKPDDT